MSKARIGLVVSLACLVVTSTPRTANATGVVTGGQFASNVSQGNPVGNGTDVPAGGAIVYYVRLDNAANANVTVNVVWTIDGHAEAPVALATNWRATWAFHAVTREMHEIAVSIRDEQGTQLYSDHMAVHAGAPAPR